MSEEKSPDEKQQDSSDEKSEDVSLKSILPLLKEMGERINQLEQGLKSQPESDTEGEEKTEENPYAAQEAALLDDYKEIIQTKHGLKNLEGIESLQEVRALRNVLQQNKIGLKSLSELSESKPKSGEQLDAKNTKLLPELSGLQEQAKG